MAPYFSVVVPVRDGGEAFHRCLAALAPHRGGELELLVVDDGSEDGSAELAEEAGARVFRTAGAEGPAAARNLGARKARAPWLWFLDADCELAAESPERLRRALEADPLLDAAFGSYDDDPPAPGFVSQYKNLQHHWVHQQGAGPAETFWAGCGAVRRSAFLAVGGFDERRYRRPCIEDVELGFRLHAAGHRIRLLPEVQVKHHKRWTLGGLVRTDLRDRALPWAELGLERGRLGRTLNVGWRGRASGAASLALLLALPVAAVQPWVAAAVGASSVLVLSVANGSFYAFLRRRRGLGFALRAVPLHWLYFAYSTTAYAWALVRHRIRRKRGGAPAAVEATGMSGRPPEPRGSAEGPSPRGGVAG